MSEPLLLWEAIRVVFAGVYSRFPIDDTNCGVVYNVKDGKKSKINTYGGKAVVGGTYWKLLAAGPNCKTRMVRTAARAISEKRLSDGQVI
ncbi:hypothetical protein Acr_20g0006410 [Actinidia rufa]|uniref:Uncharacterized protein n=1 Tax=Actinidia rufa TaxID=165716 RepID=A0A7J0GDF8_9ERIC|nr:hypothetical protein Acr_20g0006410 [Actinidia rufa]